MPSLNKVFQKLFGLDEGFLVKAKRDIHFLTFSGNSGTITRGSRGTIVSYTFIQLHGRMEKIYLVAFPLQEVWCKEDDLELICICRKK